MMAYQVDPTCHKSHVGTTVGVGIILIALFLIGYMMEWKGIPSELFDR